MIPRHGKLALRSVVLGLVIVAVYYLARLIMR